jgi:hypothetical protein
MIRRGGAGRPAHPRQCRFRSAKGPELGTAATVFDLILQPLSRRCGGPGRLNRFWVWVAVGTVMGEPLSPRPSLIYGNLQGIWSNREYVPVSDPFRNGGIRPSSRPNSLNQEQGNSAPLSGSASAHPRLNSEKGMAPISRHFTALLRSPIFLSSAKQISPGRLGPAAASGQPYQLVTHPAGRGDRLSP